jgi:hypothetical protein
MKKKPPVLRFPKPKAKAEIADRHWHNGGDIKIGLYARSIHLAAKNLIANLNLQPNTKTAWDACPVILLYRQALELHLKALVDEGSNFLRTRTDPITLYKTHSLRWLAQIVCQIIKTVRWENEFKCEGISNLAEFSAVIAELETMDPVSCAILADKSGCPDEAPEPLRKSNVLKFIPRLDALIGLLEATADALAATWDQRADVSGEGKFHVGDNMKPPIQ